MQFPQRKFQPVKVILFLPAALPPPKQATRERSEAQARIEAVEADLRAVRDEQAQGPPCERYRLVTKRKWS